MTQPIDLVRAFYAALAAGDLPGLVALLHPDLEWTEAESFPYYSGTWRRPDDVIEKLLIPLRRDWDGFSAKADDFIVEGDRVVSLGAYAGVSRATGKAMRAHGCDYCLSAHTYLGRNLARLDEAEITANRNGASNDPKADAAVRFAVAVTRSRGHIDEADLSAVRVAGYSDAQVIEIVQHVALNTWTNYFNEVFKTDIDFPVVQALKAA